MKRLRTLSYEEGFVQSGTHRLAVVAAPAAMAPPITKAAIQGAFVRELALWFERSGQPIHQQSVLQQLEPEDRMTIDPARQAFGMTVNHYYPRSILRAIALTAKDEPTTLQKSVDAVVSRLSKGLYQAAFRTIRSPEQFARNGSAFWRYLSNRGDLSTVVESGRAIITIADWPANDSLLARLAGEILRSAFATMGCRDIRMTVREPLFAEDTCHIELAYRDPL